MSFGNDMLRGVNKAAKAVIKTEERIARDCNVVEESLEICRTSTNPETRISRMGVAIERLAYMCEEYAYWPDAPAWKEQKRQLKEAYPAFIVANLSELIKSSVEKIEKLKKQETKHNKAEQLIKKLEPYLSYSSCDIEWLACQLFLIKKSYPPEGTTPILETEIPTPWPTSSQSKEEVALCPSIEEKSPIPSVKPLSWGGEVGIWAICLLLLFIITQNGIFSLIASVILTIVIAKKVNKRRRG